MTAAYVLLQGVDLDQLLDMSTDELVEMFAARQRRRCACNTTFGSQGAQRISRQQSSSDRHRAPAAAAGLVRQLLRAGVHGGRQQQEECPLLQNKTWSGIGVQ